MITLCKALLKVLINPTMNNFIHLARAVKKLPKEYRALFSKELKKATNDILKKKLIEAGLDSNKFFYLEQNDFNSPEYQNLVEAVLYTNHFPSVRSALEFREAFFAELDND